MTEQLKTLMDRAAAQDFAVVDLDAITSAGDRTVRRRRMAGGLGAAAAVAAVVAGVALLGENGDKKADVVDTPFRSDLPMWTEGSVLHTPDATYDLGVDVASFVRTSEGITFLAWGQGETWEVYTFTGHGEPDQVGVTQDTRLRADPTGPFVGWLEGTGTDLETVIYDQESETRVYGEPAKREHSYPIVAIDGDRAYLADADEGPARALDLVTGELIDLPTDEWRGYQAVKGDLVARQICCSDDGSSAIEVGTADGDGVVIDHQSADGAAFSPDGQWLSLITSSVAVFDTSTSVRIDVDTHGFSDSMGYEWLDDSTLVVAAVWGDGKEVVLLTCEIPAGSCTEVSRLPWFEGDAIAAIGLGEAVWGTAGSDSASEDATSVAEPPK